MYVLSTSIKPTAKNVIFIFSTFLFKQTMATHKTIKRNSCLLLKVFFLLHYGCKKNSIW